MGQSYRTARGTVIDMGKLISKNELVPAVGNAKVNARGDKLGPGGKIVKRREEIISQNAGPIPNQINVPAPQPAPVTQTVAPSVQTPVAAPAKSAPAKKDITNQDPEGNE